MCSAVRCTLLLVESWGAHESSQRSSTPTYVIALPARCPARDWLVSYRPLARFLKDSFGINMIRSQKWSKKAWEEPHHPPPPPPPELRPPPYVDDDECEYPPERRDDDEYDDRGGRGGGGARA